MTGDLRVGLIARAEATGLGHMTWEFARHVRPHRVLVVDLSAHGRPSPTADDLTRLSPDWPAYVGMYGGDGQFVNVNAVKQMLDEIDVLYTAETPYDWRVFDWARDRGVATVLHVMPELLDRDLVAAHPPTELWAPTPWRMARLPAGVRLVPVPIALDRLAEHATWRNSQRRVSVDRHPGGVLRVLHHAASAMADRNGTRDLIQSLRHVTEPMHISIVTGPGISVPGPRHALRPGVTVDVINGVANYWDAFGEYDVHVMPRRYGGLCLPAQEAAGAGLGLLMSDCSPNVEYYPSTPMTTIPLQPLECKGGVVDRWKVQPETIAFTLNQYARSPATTDIARQRAQKWAADLDWSVWAPTYRDALASAYEASQGG